MPNQFISPEGDIENYFITESWLIDQWVGDTLWAWGTGSTGMLGNNSTTDISTPITTLSGGANWKQVASGNNHTAAIKTDGTLWSWSRNANGQLGINNATTPICTPVTTFAGGTNWKQVSCNGYHTAAIKTDGTLWTWGRNDTGQLGINNALTPICTPVTTFVGGTNWKQVSCGGIYTAAIKTDGTLWTWGYNFYGSLGVNDTVTRSTPVTTFAGGTNWKQVAGGYFNVAAIKTDGTLWTWGANFSGSLGINNTSQRNTPVTTFAGGTNWKQVSACPYNTAAIKTDGTLWTFGDNVSGQLGINNVTSPICTPVTTFTGGTNWKQVSGAHYHTAAIKTDGALWIWGRNSYGRLGDNTVINRSTPITTFAGGTNWKQVTCGQFHTAAVTSGTDPTYFIS